MKYKHLFEISLVVHLMYHSASLIYLFVDSKKGQMRWILILWRYLLCRIENIPFVWGGSSKLIFKMIDLYIPWSNQNYIDFFQRCQMFNLFGWHLTIFDSLFVILLVKFAFLNKLCYHTLHVWKQKFSLRKQINGWCPYDRAACGTIEQ